MSRRPQLPTPWYYTAEELAHEWGCAPARVLYYLDAGLMTPAALVPRNALRGVVPDGPAPHVCVMLEGYRDLRWRHTAHGSRADLQGTFQAIAIDRQWIEPFELELAKPTPIKRSDLVVPIDQKERLERVESLDFVRETNPAERRTMLAIIAGLIRADPALARQGRYSIANVVGVGLAGCRVRPTSETIAVKIGEALAAANRTARPTLDAGEKFGLQREEMPDTIATSDVRT